MAFNLDNMGRVSSGANDAALRVWIYNALATGANNTLAEVAASGYFNDMQVTLATADGPLQIGDVVYVNGSDGRVVLSVTAVTTAVTTATF